MKYTPSPAGDKKVEQDMKIICREILEKIKDTETIILTGGFSRGEGPVKIEKNKILPYNDYDIQVISRTPISKEETDKISVEISKKIGYVGIVNFYPFKKEEQKMKDNFYLDLKVDSPESLKKMLPRIRTYELKNNSMILHGKDLRNLIPDYSLRDIPLSEGAKLLLDRMSQMIEYYSTGKKYEKEFLTYIIQQAYAACCTSLLLLSKKYEIGYKKSMEILKKTYKQDFPELHEKIPNLTKKIEQFIKWKLNPRKLPNKDVEKEWFTAKENILEVSKYFFSKFLGKKIDTIEELSHAILDMRNEFYNPYINQMIKNLTGIKNARRGLLSSLSLSAVYIVLAHKYNKRLKKLGVKKRVNIFSKYSPEFVIFSSLIYLISSISENGIDENMLNKSKRELGRVYPVKGRDWEEVSVDYANAYIAFFLQKI
jgi:hypothetical protein